MGAALIIDDPEIAWYYPELIYQPRKDGNMSWPSSALVCPLQGIEPGLIAWKHSCLPTMLQNPYHYIDKYILLHLLLHILLLHYYILILNIYIYITSLYR